MRSFDRAWHVVYQDSTAAILPARRDSACVLFLERNTNVQPVPAGYPAGDYIIPHDRGGSRGWVAPLSVEKLKLCSDGTQPREKGVPSKMAAGPGK